MRCDHGWCSWTENRHVPLAVVLVTLVKAWHVRCALREPALLPEALPWYSLISVCACNASLIIETLCVWAFLCLQAPLSVGKYRF